MARRYDVKNLNVRGTAVLHADVLVNLVVCNM